MTLTKDDLIAIEELLDRKLEPIKADIVELKTDVAKLKTDVAELKTDVAELKADVAGLKAEVSQIKTDLQHLQAQQNVFETMLAQMKDRLDSLDGRMKRIELNMENNISKSIQLLAENHIETISKMNAAVRVQDKSAILEVQLNGLSLRLEKVELELKELKERDDRREQEERSKQEAQEEQVA